MTSVEIGSAITAELRTIIDYHNCRVYLLQPDGANLYAGRVPRRAVLGVREGDRRVDSSPSRRGHDRHGSRRARSRSSRRTRRRWRSRSRSKAPTTSLESMLAGAYGRGRTGDGVIVLSILGYGEVRRGGPAPARGARIPRRRGVRERQAVSGPSVRPRRRRPPCSELSQTLTAAPTRSTTSCRMAIDTVPILVRGLPVLAAYLRDEETGGLPPPALRRSRRRRDRSGRPLDGPDVPRRRRRERSSRASPTRSSSRKRLVVQAIPEELWLFGRGARRPGGSAALGARWVRRDRDGWRRKTATPSPSRTCG